MRKKVIVGLLLVLGLMGGYWFLSRSEGLNLLMDGSALQALIVKLGFWGPPVIILLLATAIVWSPIPSAPIALAAGAAYGHSWGTVYVVLGAELGSLLAFTIARLLGRKTMEKWFGERLSLGWLGSQNALMVLVLITRLLPFVSFDIVSYAMGLTPLTIWRFAIATVVGIIPASYVLAHFGSEMVSGDTQQVVTTILLLLGIMSIPVLLKFILHRRHPAPESGT